MTDARINNADLQAMLTIAGIHVEVVHTHQGTVFELFYEGPSGDSIYMSNLPLGAPEELWRATIAKLVEDGQAGV